MNKIYLYGAGAVGILVIAGVAYNLIVPDKPNTTTRTETKTESTEKLKQTEEENLRLKQQVNSLVTEFNKLSQTRDLNTKTTEVRYVYPPNAQPNSGSNPIIINPAMPQLASLDRRADRGDSSLVPVSLPVQPIEITVKTSETTERSKTDSSTEVKVDTTTKTDAEVSAKTMTEAESTEKTETKTETKTENANNSDTFLSKVGIGITSERKPALTYDIVNTPLGPRIFNLGRVGAGGFITQTSDNQIGGGPQINYQQKRFFIGIGHELREKKTLGIIGFKF